MVGRIASRLALVTGPKIATTRSRWISSRVRSTAVLGSVWSSAMTSSNRRPRTPPASLASSIASRVPCTPCCPRFSRPPESGCSTPTLIGSAARAREGTASASAVVEAAPCNRRRRDAENDRSVARVLVIAGPPSGCDAVLERRAPQQRRGDLAAVGDDAEVRADVVQRRLLLARPGGGHAVLRHDHLVAEEKGVVHRGAHADVGDDAEDHQRVHLDIAQREVQVRVEEGGVATLEDVDVVGSRVQVLDDLGAPAPLETVRRALEKFAVLAYVPAVRVDHEQDGAARVSSGVDDLPLGRDRTLVAGQHHGAARLTELVEHVDHDDAGGLGVDADLTLEPLRGEDIDGHGGLLENRADWPRLLTGRRMVSNGLLRPAPADGATTLNGAPLAPMSRQA